MVSWERGNAGACGGLTEASMDPGTLKQIAEMERLQRDGDRTYRLFVVCLIVGALVILIGVGFLAYRSVTLDDAARARFMRQCMEDHKEYECTALWRAGNRSGPDIIPIPIPIPTR